MKKILAILGIVLAVLILVAVALPFFIDANQFKPTLETDLSAALGRKVDIGNISLSIWSGSVAVDNVAIADDPAFSHSPFLTAKQLSAGVELVPLVFSKTLNVTSFTIAQPQVSLIRSASGTWNYSSLGAKSAKSSSSSSAPGNFTVQKLSLVGGQMTVSEPGGKRRAYSDVNLSVQNFSYSSQFPFQFSASTPGQGTISLSGNAGPIDPADASMTPLHATITVTHLDLSSTGFLDPASGLGGLVDFKGQLDSTGRAITSTGTLKAQSLKLTADASPSTVPVAVDYDMSFDPKKQDGVLKKGNLAVGKATAALTGTFDASGQVASVQMKMAGPQMSVSELEGILPAIGVKLPQGASLQSGTLATTLAITGPVDKLVIAGPVKLTDAKMTGFSLSGALGALSSFAGLGKTGGSDTEIQELSADLRIDPQGQHAQNLQLVAPAIGTLTGAGDASATGELNCKMVAMLSTTAGTPIGALGSAMSSLTGGGAGKSGSGIPFKIQGTTSHPVFVPDMAGMAKGFLNNAGGTSNGTSNGASGAAGAASSVLNSIFGKKKTQ